MALDEAGLLDDRLALVHLVTARPADLDRVAARGAMAILCPRSNLHITGLLPPVAAMAERGIGLALGTDSLASNSDLDVLEEARLLARRFSSLPRALWMEALTAGGATVLGDPARGHLRVGAGVQVGASSLVTEDVPPGRKMSGTPAVEHGRWLRSAVAVRDLPALLDRVRSLERRVMELERAGAPDDPPEGGPPPPAGAGRVRDR
jgi:hypothetical protein